MPNEVLEIRISRHFAASAEDVFAEWLSADSLKDWFTPNGYQGTSAAADARVGGRWHVEYESAAGQRIREHGAFLAIHPVNRLSMTLTQGPDMPETTIHVTLARAPDGGTLMHFVQSGFDNMNHRDGNAEGWLGCFDKLATRVATKETQK